MSKQEIINAIDTLTRVLYQTKEGSALAEVAEAKLADLIKLL